VWVLWWTQQHSDGVFCERFEFLLSVSFYQRAVLSHSSPTLRYISRWQHARTHARTHTHTNTHTHTQSLLPSLHGLGCHATVTCKWSSYTSADGWVLQWSAAVESLPLSILCVLSIFRRVHKANTDCLPRQVRPSVLSIVRTHFCEISDLGSRMFHLPCINQILIITHFNLYLYYIILTEIIICNCYGVMVTQLTTLYLCIPVIITSPWRWPY